MNEQAKEKKPRAHWDQDKLSRNIKQYASICFGNGYIIEAVREPAQR